MTWNRRRRPRILPSMDTFERRAVRAAAASWDVEGSKRCAVCGYARINVRHETDPETAPEGPDYYRDMTDLHEFVSRPESRPPATRGLLR